jgi:hypothetical protein
MTGAPTAMAGAASSTRKYVPAGTVMAKDHALQAVVSGSSALSAGARANDLSPLSGPANHARAEDG